MAMMLLVLLASTLAIGDAVKILPLGDSITFGCGDRCENNCVQHKYSPSPCSNCSGGYRQYLWRSLRSEQLFDNQLEFVGTQENGPDDINKHHNGYPGWTVKQVHEVNTTWLPTRPDIILLHLGTNDMGIGLQQAAATALRMDALIANIFAELPHVHIFLASIIGSTWIYGGQNHVEYNKLQHSLVDTYTQKGFRITYVDMYTDADLGPSCDLGLCCPDRIHPQLEGYMKIAAVWLSALKGAYGHQVVV